MSSIVFMTKKAQKDLKNAPKHIQIQFGYWIKEIEIEGYFSIQKNERLQRPFAER